MAGSILPVVTVLTLIRLSVHGTNLTSFSLLETGSIRLLHQYQTLRYDSRLKCLIQCHLDANCKAVNYQGSSQTCELNEINWDTIGGLHSETIVGWTVYLKGIPSCDNGWMLNGHSCYFFSTDKMAWLDAAAVCENDNSTLVQIDNEHENNFLVQRIKLIHGEAGGDFHYWTNGNDKDVQNQWVWGHPGNQNIGNYTNWFIEDPNGGTIEDCIALHGYLNFKWSDRPCDAEYFYICEKLPFI